MLNKYMFSYHVINIDKSRSEYTLGTQEGGHIYDAKERLNQKIESEYPESEGWEILSLLFNEEPVEYVFERE